jgi:putative DNA primase/helicase
MTALSATASTAKILTDASVPIVPRSITVHHLLKIQSSGITLDFARAAGIYSETAPAMLQSLLNNRKWGKKIAPALVFPYTRPDGRNGYCRVRPDRAPMVKGKAAKYLSPSATPNELYFPPGVASLEFLQDASRELIFTEGELKALKATQEGFLCIGLVGIFGWKKGKSESLLPTFDLITLKGRPVFIAFDSDKHDKPEVLDAESRFAALLANAGAVVKCIQVPPGLPDADGKPTKNGLDDYLVSQPDPKKAMRALMNAAEDPEPPEAGSVKISAGEIDAVPEASRYLDTTKMDDVPRLRYWRGAFHSYIHGAYRETLVSDVRGTLIDFLDETYFKLSSSHVNNVMDCLKAKARLFHRIEPPAWIEIPPQNSEKWKPDEILATRRSLVHLPSFASKQRPYGIVGTPRFFTQNSLDYEFDPEAPLPDEFLGFLNSLWKDDPQSISMLQEWFGYCLLQDTRQQKILMLIGPPRSGKGTIARILRRLIGNENVCGPTLSSLGGPFGLQNLLGKSLAIISDARLGSKTDSAVVTERLLAISGEDALTVDRKCIESVTCKLPTRLMFLSNELPRLHDSSGALSNRMIILRLTESFLGKEDTALTDRLLTELPGILLWAVDGWNRLQSQGRFTQPISAADLIQELADLSSPIAAFVREKCDVGPLCEIARKDLYTAYRAWAMSKGRDRVEEEHTFGRNLRAALPALGDARRTDESTGKQFRCYTGIEVAKS